MRNKAQVNHYYATSSRIFVSATASRPTSSSSTVDKRRVVVSWVVGVEALGDCVLSESDNVLEVSNENDKGLGEVSVGMMRTLKFQIRMIRGLEFQVRLAKKNCLVMVSGQLIENLLVL